MKATITLLLLLTLFSLNTFAQDYTQWGLSDGAIARLGKGQISGQIAYSPDGTRLAVRCGIGVWLYDTSTDQEVALLTVSWGESVVFSPDGRTIALGDGHTIRLWDAISGAHTRVLTGHTAEVNSVAFSPNGRTIASGSGNFRENDNTIRLWDATSGAHKRTLTGHTFAVLSIAFSPDGHTIASGSGDGTVLLWDLIPPATTTATLSVSPSPVPSPTTGAPLTLTLKITDGENVAGYQATVEFDTSVLRYVESANGDYLKADAFFVSPVVEENRGTLASTAIAGGSNGDGTLATLTFEVVAVKASVLTLFQVTLVDPDGERWFPRIKNGEVPQPPQLFGDVNTDGVVNIQDLVLVGANFGKTGKHIADVNGDGVVDIVDLVKVAVRLETRSPPYLLYIHRH